MIQARLAPPGAIVRTSTGTEYVRCRRIKSVMRWGQPIPGSGDWLVEVIGQLPPGEDLTDREKAEVCAATRGHA